MIRRCPGSRPLPRDFPSHVRACRLAAVSVAHPRRVETPLESRRVTGDDRVDFICQVPSKSPRMIARDDVSAGSLDGRDHHFPFRRGRRLLRDPGPAAAVAKRLTLHGKHDVDARRSPAHGSIRRKTGALLAKVPKFGENTRRRSHWRHIPRRKSGRTMGPRFCLHGGDPMHNHEILGSGRTGQENWALPARRTTVR